jgi:Ca2+-binding EF-hand superfamily protein
MTSSLQEIIHNEFMSMTELEEKELRRVFDLLCDFATKEQMSVNTIEAGNHKLRIENSSSTKDTKQDTSYLSRPATEMNALISQQASQLKRIDLIVDPNSNNNANKKISAQDVTEMYKYLKHKTTKKDIEEMIWECDEDLDQCLNWAEFKLMYSRNLQDRTGLEPNRMFNLTQFLIYDKSRSGRVSVDDTMNMLFARFGRAKMELKLRELFGDEMPENGRVGGGEIDFPAYLAAVERTQMQTFLGTTKGKMVASKSVSKKSGKLPSLKQEG